MSGPSPLALARRHSLLLRAALAERSAALEAWRLWRGEIDLDQLDSGSLRLLPLAFWNLGEALGDDAFDRWVRGIVRASWLKGQSLLVGARPVLERLRAAGIPVLVGKGAVAARSYPRGLSTRPMLDLDVAVPEKHRYAAWSIFETCGFAPYGERRADTAEVEERTSWNFRSSRGAELDLHWRALPGVTHPDADRLVWDAARPFPLAGLDLLAPAPRHLVFQTLLHVAEWDPEPHAIWAADLVAMLRAPAPRGIDWQALVRDARRLRIEAIVEAGLRFVADELGLCFPALGALAPSRWQRRELRSLRRRPVERSRSQARALELGRRIRSQLPPGDGPTLRRRIDLATANRRGLRSPAYAPLWGAFVTLGRPSLFRGYAERLRRAPAPEAAPAPPLRLEFGRGRSAEPFLADGWEDGAEHGRWTRGCDARLTLRFPESWIPGDLELDARMVVGLWPDDPRREVELWVNGRRQARWHFEGDAPAAALKRVRLARELLRDRRLALLVHVPRPYAPSAQFGHCRVPRAFGVHLGWIRLEPASS